MTSSSATQYQRIIIKMSGEALAGKSSLGIDPQVLESITIQVAKLHKLGVQIGIVIGGGNLFRGQALSEAGIDRVTGDHMGMLSTLMNALALRDVFERYQLSTRIMSAIPMSGIVDHYDRRKAIHHLSLRRIVLFAAGTGSPLVTTDSAASLRAIEVEADVLIKATQVDGIYDQDPNLVSTAKRFESLTYDQVLANEYSIMDLAAFCQCRDHQVPICVLNLSKEDALLRFITGKKEGTLVQGRCEDDSRIN